MAARPDGDTVSWLEGLDRDGSFAGMGDSRLLGRFLERADSAGGLAFEALVRRHGPMVLARCRGILADEHAAADAFQATFVVLARRAAKVRDRDRLAPWLCRVARRIALRSRAESTRRAALERRLAPGNAGAARALEELAGLETASLVRAEVDRLPESDRLLLRMTYWQGKTYEEAALLLSWPIGTVRSRLSRARDRLRSRLARLGLAPALGLGVAGSTSPAEGAMAARLPEALILRTVRVATRHSADLTAAVGAGMVPASVAALVNGELATMATIPWKPIASMLLLGTTVTAGVASLARPGPDDPAAGPIANPQVAPEAAGPTPQPQATAKAEARSILANGGVEDGTGDLPKGWTSGAKIPGVEYSWSREGHEGKASLRLKKTAQRYFPVAQWAQEVDRQGNGPRLKVSAWVKADQATKAVLDVQFVDAKGQKSHAWASYIGPKDPEKPPVTHDWKRYEGVVTIPPDTRQILVAPQLYGPGTVWFDDLGAEYTDDPASDPLASAS